MGDLMPKIDVIVFSHVITFKANIYPGYTGQGNGKIGNREMEKQGIGNRKIGNKEMEKQRN